MRLQAVLSALILFGLGLASEVAAEGPPGKAFIKGSHDLKLNVDLVSLNVVVTDQKGYAVQGLSKEEFKVYENRVEQHISFFSQEEAPVSWGLALDRSRSMGAVIREVHQAALHVIEEGLGQDEMFVLAFNDENQMVQNFTSDRNRLANSLFGLDSSGRTAMFDAVAFALERLQEGRHPKKALIVVTDGEDNSSELSLKELIEIPEEKDVVIYVIGTFEPSDPRRPGLSGWETRWQLERLAKATGGRAFFPTNVHQCQEVVKKITLEVSHQYSLGYYARRLADNAEWRRIKVEVRHRESGTRPVARTRSRYLAANR